MKEPQNTWWDEYVEDSAYHRNETDPDVVVVLHRAQEWAEIDTLRRQDRLPAS